MWIVPLGSKPSYPAVMDHPAEACVADLELMKNNAPEMYREVTGEPLPDPVLTADALAERVRSDQPWLGATAPRRAMLKGAEELS